MRGIELRLATEEESSALAAIFSVLYKAEEKWSQQKIKENITQKRNEYYLAFADCHPLGALSLRIDSQSCEVNALAVKKPGQYVGSQLLHYAEALARARGCTRIWCQSLECYQAAHFYEKYGWVEEKCIPNFLDGLKCFIYAKRL